VHLVGFTIEMYYDARPCKRQILVTSHSIKHEIGQLYIMKYRA